MKHLSLNTDASIGKRVGGNWVRNLPFRRLPAMQTRLTLNAGRNTGHRRRQTDQKLKEIVDQNADVQLVTHAYANAKSHKERHHPLNELNNISSITSSIRILVPPSQSTTHILALPITLTLSSPLPIISHEIGLITRRRASCR